VDFRLSDEQRLIRQTARAFCDAEIVPHASEWDRTETIDRGNVSKLAELGFLAAALPEAYGGMGLGTVSYALVVEEIGRADSNVRGIVSVSNGLYGKSVARWGTDEQKQRLLPGLASGETLGCYALTEPGAGSDPGSLETRAERDGDGWAISGQKIFITLGSWASFALVFARTGGAGPRGITCFVVETEAARLLVWRAAAAADAGEPYTVEASIAKYFASEVAVRAANAAVQAHGGYGYVDEYPVGKYLRDARVTTLYEGTSQIQKLLIGRALTGESAFA
jgi:alkylation response protein AidB-like acyl-CoA dehydrogenase